MNGGAEGKGRRRSVQQILQSTTIQTKCDKLRINQYSIATTTTGSTSSKSAQGEAADRLAGLTHMDVHPGAVYCLVHCHVGTKVAAW